MYVRMYVCISKLFFHINYTFKTKLLTWGWPDVILGQKQRYSVGKVCNQFISIGYVCIQSISFHNSYRGWPLINSGNIETISITRLEWNRKSVERAREINSRQLETWNNLVKCYVCTYTEVSNDKLIYQNQR